jgi:predicted esterase
MTEHSHLTHPHPHPHSQPVRSEPRSGRQKIAVLVIHGLGNQETSYAEEFTRPIYQALCKHWAGDPRSPADDIVFQPVYWAPLLQWRQNDLLMRFDTHFKLDFMPLRRLFAGYLGDVFAYQPTPKHGDAYDLVHECMAAALAEAAIKVGPEAPLVIVGHSLGGVIAFNHFYELQFGHGCGYSCANAQHWRDSEIPLVRGETLAGLYTIGTPLALWTVRFLDSGEAIRVPAPQFPTHYPGVGGEWINLFDVDDIIAWPLRCVNAHFAAAVTEDREVQAGGMFTGWNPAVHETYARCDAVIDTVVQGIVRLYESVNPRPEPRPER